MDMNRKMSLNRISYRREKEIEMDINGAKGKFILITPSAKQTERAAVIAEQIHATRIQRLTASEKNLREVYLTQSDDLLCEYLLNAENEIFREKAGNIILPEGEDYEEKIRLKVENLRAKRLSEISVLPKEDVIDQLIQTEVNRQIQISWIYSSLNAILVEVLRDENREKLFDTVDEMQEMLSLEMLNQFLEALDNFLNERGSAQVFPEPHTFNG